MKQFIRICQTAWLVATIGIVLILTFLYYKDHIKVAESITAPERELLPYKEGIEMGAYMANNGLNLSYTAFSGLKTTTPEMEDWLTKLEAYENCPSEGILDSNNLRSYGPLCFQRATFLGYMKRFGSQVMPFAEEGEYLNNLSDRRTQRHLARLIIEDDHSAWRNWFTSVAVRKGLGQPPKPSTRNHHP